MNTNLAITNITIALTVVLAIAIALVLAPIAMAEDQVWENGSCYRYWLAKDTLIIQTGESLTTEKEVMLRSSKEVEKQANDMGKSVYGRLMKMPTVATVVLAPREIAIRLYPYPPNPWGRELGNVLEQVEAVLCANTPAK